MVTTWWLTSISTIIEYERKEDGIWYHKTMVLTPEESARELCAIGSIDEVSETPGGIVLTWDDNKSVGMWDDFINGKHSSFKLCQWEALTLAIRHEAKLEAEKEVKNSDIGKAIDKLLK
jgi:hypothetical protein